MIEFWTSRDPYYEFSNFYGRKTGTLFTLHDKDWPTSEHYYQAMKFRETSILNLNGDEYNAREFVRSAKTPKLAKEAAYYMRPLFDPDWDSKKELVMLDALLAKFSQNADLKKMLISTGDAILVEKSTKDSYWGTGPDRKGRNRLGIMLMSARWILANDNEWMLELACKSHENNPYHNYEWRDNA